MEVVKAFNENGMHTEIVIRGTHEKPLFRASDIGEVLEIINIRTTIHHFNDTEKAVHSMDTLGGTQQVSFLTAKGLYKVLFKSRKPIAEQFQNWVCDVVEELRITGSYNLQQQNQELQNRLIQTEEEKAQLLRDNDFLKILETKIPMIYIYNTNKNTKESELPLLKIGHSNDLQKRIKPYGAVCHGEIIFKLEIKYIEKIVDENEQKKHLKMLEKSIHEKLWKYNVEKEMFRMDIEYAKLCIMNEYNYTKIFYEENDIERQQQIKKIYELTNDIINKTQVKVSTFDESTQTEYNELEPVLSQPIIQGDQELFKKFDDFIENHCIVRSDVEVSAKKIVGQYRIVAREAKREVTQALTDYLKRKYKYDRLKIQDKDQVVYGFVGVMLKTIDYKKQINSTEEEIAVYEKCVFTPDGTALFKDILKEYQDWKRTMNIPYNNTDEDKLKKYLKSNKNLLFETVWASGGGGQGFYGMNLKKDTTRQRNSSTGSKVEKRDGNNMVLATFDTIAKAAEHESICAAKMSRSIKNKVIFNGEGGEYNYCKKE